MEQCTFHKPQFTYVSVTFLFANNMHFQDHHTHFYGTFVEAVDTKIDTRKTCSMDVIQLPIDKL